MNTSDLKNIVLFICIFIFVPGICETIKRFQTNVRNSGIVESRIVRSLLECSVLFEQSPNYLSFNYHKSDKICEMSNLYPESSTSEVGWSVNAYIVDGSWSNWFYTGSCSVSCGVGSRSMSRRCDNPSPSNGGENCQGSNAKTQSCDAGSCTQFVGGYHRSSGRTNWNTAKTNCESASARLVIIDSQQKQDDLLALYNNQALDHWIGMTCEAGENCVWIDGRSVDSGYKSWAPNEPSDKDCVYIGLNNNNWDDTDCNESKNYICEPI